jgi:hypothetical protein
VHLDRLAAGIEDDDEEYRLRRWVSDARRGRDRRHYAAFERYPLRDVIEGCPCCVSPTTASGSIAYAAPAYEEDLGRYAAKALDLG